MKVVIRALTAALLLCPRALTAQTMPADYQSVLTMLDRKGDFKESVLKINIPRTDLAVTVAGVKTPTPFGFGGWIAMTKGEQGMEVLMGDLVLTQDEVSPVMSALLDNGLEVTALHNHFFWEEPRVYYMHVHGHGHAEKLASQLKPALDLIGKGATATPDATATSSSGQLDSSRVAQIVGKEGEQTGAVYKITVGRSDLTLTEMGAPINARMGLNTWAAFTGTNERAAIAGDVAMLSNEVTPVLKALRRNGLDVVAIHHHMLQTQPAIFFLHYWGTGPAEKLATGFREALAELGKSQDVPRVLFICPHGAAKSVLASSYFQQMAKDRGLNVQVDFAGMEPDPQLSPRAVERLNARGYAPPPGSPRKVTREDLASADLVISIGCNVDGLATGSAKVRRWDDVPSPSDDFDRADEAILERVTQLVAELAAEQRKH